MKLPFQNALNRFTYKLKKRIRWSRSYVEKGGGYDPLENISRHRKKVRSLIQNYRFHRLHEKLSQTAFYENLYFINILDRLAPPTPSNGSVLIDVGSSRFSYVLALQSYFGMSLSQIVGTEIDPYGRDKSLHTRIEKAKFYMTLAGKNKAAGSETRFLYKRKNFCKINMQADIVTCFFPMVFKGTHLAWGLPLSTFDPEDMFHNFSRILRNRNSYAIVVNQSEKELSETMRLLDGNGIQRVKTEIVESPVPTRRKTAFASLVCQG